MKVTPESLRLRALIDEHRDEMNLVFERYGAINPSLFGSVARGDATSTSDIDIMVDLEEIGGSRIMRLLEMSEELRQILNVRVDVVSPSVLKEQVSEQAQKELVLL